MRNRLPEGPGSRGGRWHDPEFRRAYYRAWRAAHPEYRERERARRREARAVVAERAGVSRVAAFTDTLLLVVAEDVVARGVSRVAADLGMSHRAVGRWVHRHRALGGDGIDAIVAAYGIEPLALLHGLATDEAVERRLAAGQRANFRGRNQHSGLRRGRDQGTDPADTTVTPTNPLPPEFAKKAA